MVPTMVPIAASFVLPILFRLKPDVAVPINNTIINGSWTLAVVIASPPNPSGRGLCTMTGMV